MNVRLVGTYVGSTYVGRYLTGLAVRPECSRKVLNTAEIPMWGARLIKESHKFHSVLCILAVCYSRCSVCPIRYISTVPLSSRQRGIIIRSVIKLLLKHVERYLLLSSAH